MTIHLETISAIGNLTKAQQAIFRAICRAWIDADMAFGISGSLALGTCDAYSDLDFFFLKDESSSLENAIDLATETDSVLVKYYSENVFMKDSAILYFDVGNSIVKVDISAISTGDCLPSHSKIYHDPHGKFDNDQHLHALGFDNLAYKFSGWLWVIHGRIERGELLSAMRCVDFCRELVVLPILLDRLGLPQSGHRRLEQLVPEYWLKKIHGTVPVAVSKAELERIAQNLLKIFYELCQGTDVGISSAAMKAIMRTSDIIAMNSGFTKNRDRNFRLSA